MQYSSSLFLFLGIQAAAAAAAAVDVVQSRDDGGIEGYSIEPFVWDVPVFPGGENATIAGTVEEVHAELIRRNPQWDTDFPLAEMADDKVAARGLEARTDFRGARTVCGPGSFGWSKASTYEIRNGIRYLNGVSGRPSQGPGPGSCGRVSCSWSSAIWWCNDVRALLPLPFSLPPLPWGFAGWAKTRRRTLASAVRA